MSEPRRLSERFGTGVERDLLLLGASERPDAGVRERAAARVLEAAALGATLGAAASGASGKASTGLAALFAKWVGAGLVIGTAATWAGSTLLEPKPAAREGAPATTASAAPVAVGRPASASVPTQTPEVTVEGTPTPPAASRNQGDVRIGATSTLVEGESMRRVRAEAKNDRARALRLVDEHLLRFPTGESAAEARRLQAELARRK